MTSSQLKASDIYHVFCLALPKWARESLASEKEYLVNFDKQWDQMFDIMKKGVAPDASLTKKEAVTGHIGPKLASVHVPQKLQEQATEDFWMGDFVGEAPLKGLQAHVAKQLSPANVHIYGCYCSIIQSSGMGKSCLLDEFLKFFFLIPINLCSVLSQGYPPADQIMHDFLKNMTYNSQDTVNALMGCFLLALLKNTKLVVGKNMGSSQIEQILNFWSYMSKDQSMSSPGGGRLSFYKDVVCITSETPPTDEQLGSQEVTSFNKGNLLNLSPHYTSLPTWEGHCKVAVWCIVPTDQTAALRH
ncbi:hypothetical protein V8E53_005240 [Lactarius tabidus]